jgi:HlyD family secretion protein
MFRKYGLPLLAITGVCMAIYTVKAGSKEVVPAAPISEPASAPFERYVAGAGLIEASTENIAVGATVPGLVVDVFVAVGEKVKAGQPLFEVDSRDLQATLAIRKSAVAQSEAQLARLRSQPRTEDLPPLVARVRVAQAAMANAERELARVTRSGSASTRDEIDRATFAVEQNRGEVETAEAELSRVRAGAWRPDVEIAEAQVAMARSEMMSVNVEIDRRTVRAPVAGKVMQAKIRKGEYAAAGPLSTPLMLIGDVDVLHVRVDVDENDAWRIEPDAAAKAFVRGNSALSTELKFVRIEPYIVPKRSLTGDSSERVDTRVLQLLFAFDAGKLPVYAGQQMDVFIETKK